MNKIPFFQKIKTKKVKRNTSNKKKKRPFLGMMESKKKEKFTTNCKVVWLINNYTCPGTTLQF